MWLGSDSSTLSHQQRDSLVARAIGQGQIKLALDERAGRVLWISDGKNVGTPSSPVLSRCMLSVGDGGLSDSFFYPFVLDDSFRWRFQVPKQIFSSPAVKERIGHVHVRDDHVCPIDAPDRKVLWKTPAPAPQE
jgi:hypothetical protein